MPLRYFICPDGEQIEIAKCLADKGCRMRRRCASRSYLRMASSDRPWIGVPSTTQLIGGTMLAFLKITHDYAVMPHDRAFMIHGTKGHSILEAMDDDQSLLEERLSVDAATMSSVMTNDMTMAITGIADCIEFEGGMNTLWDVKTSGSFKIAKAIGLFSYDQPTGEIYKSGPRKGEAKTVKAYTQRDDMRDMRDWELQLNLYRIMIERQNIPIHLMKILAVVRDGGTYIAYGRGIYNNVYTIPVKRMPDDDVLSYFNNKREGLLKALKQGYWDTPCDEDENWGGLRCDKYCEVSQFCPLGIHRAKEREKEMPIKKWSNVVRWQRGGKIRLGIKETNKEGKEYPKEVDFFILDPATPDREKREALIKEFHDLYGEKPQSIDIQFPGDDIDSIFPQWYKRYNRSEQGHKAVVLQCQGDGETANCMSPDYTKDLEVIGTSESGLPIVRCDGDNCPYYKSNKCSEHAILKVLLPKIASIDIWEIPTGSFNSVANINNGVELLRGILERVGIHSFAGVTLRLERVEQEMTHNGIKSIHWPLKLDPGWRIDDITRASREQGKLMKYLELPESYISILDVVDNERPALPPASETQAGGNTQIPDAIEDEIPQQENPEQNEAEPSPEPQAQPEDIAYSDAIVVLSERTDISCADIQKYVDSFPHKDMDKVLDMVIQKNNYDLFKTNFGKWQARIENANTDKQ